MATHNAAHGGLGSSMAGAPMSAGVVPSHGAGRPVSKTQPGSSRTKLIAVAVVFLFLGIGLAIGILYATQTFG
jgi:hypothetical protein